MLFFLFHWIQHGEKGWGEKQGMSDREVLPPCRGWEQLITPVPNSLSLRISGLKLQISALSILTSQRWEEFPSFVPSTITIETSSDPKT